MSACPRCGDALRLTGRRFACSRCQGVLVPTADVQAMLSEMGVLYAAAIAYDPTRDRRGRPEPVEPPPPGALVAGSLPCPHCGYAMAQQELADHVVDVCDEHGYWFDGRELAAVLERSAGVAEPTTGMKWRRFLQGLFYDQPALSTDVKKPDDL